jgi:ammonium transporter, Amt family
MPWAAVLIGLCAGTICYFACTLLKQKLGYDDSLDVFGVHGIGGITGTLLCGVFAAASVGETAGLLEGNPSQLLIQFYGVVATVVWCGVVTFVLLKLIGVFIPLRVSTESEQQGLDITQHGESIHA